MMHTSDFFYTLPASSIAQFPVDPRDHSRMMMMDKHKKTITHHHFFDIIDYLRAGDVLVWNVSKVFKARLLCELLSSTGRVLRDHTRPVELFLVRPTGNAGVWKALGKPGKHITHGCRLSIAPDFFCDVLLKETDGTILVQFSDDDQTVRAKANIYGHIPVPPYVHEEPKEESQYQTVYGKVEGSVAAPTAGFHFTPELIAQLEHKGVQFAEVILHVGLGTFLPVKTEHITEHVMHAEYAELSQETVEMILAAKREGRRVIAVGTTTVRTLEGIAQMIESEHADTGTERPLLRSWSGDLNIFIYPGFSFRVVDALITNFHLPKSTLLMLVCAFVGDTPFVLSSYMEAIQRGYRFFSFGDALFIR